MKIVIALAMLVSSIAFSEVKRSGTFVPSMCSDNKRERVSLCLGSRVAMEGSFISIEDYHARTVDVYEVVERKAGNGGINPLFRLEVLLLDNGNETIEVEHRWNNSVRGSEVYIVRLNDGRVINFADFHVVYTTM